MTYQFTERPLTLFSKYRSLAQLYCMIQLIMVVLMLSSHLNGVECIIQLIRVVLMLSSHLNGVECILKVILCVRKFKYGSL